MHVLRSKKTGIDCGWSNDLWRTGAFELVDDNSGHPTPPKVIAGVEAATGLNLSKGTVAPADGPLDVPEPLGVVSAAPAESLSTFVTDVDEPAMVAANLFPLESGSDAEDNS